MGSFELSELAIASLKDNVILYDDKDMPSIFYKLPKMTMADLISAGSSNYHPAFIIDGVVKDYIYIGRFQGRVSNGRMYSWPGVDPTAKYNFDNALAYNAAKGVKFHEITAAEWGLLALWCKKNGFLPWGNNYYGKDSRENLRVAIPTYMDSAKIGRVATGSGPVKWSHNNQINGIYDLNGNVSEWVAGIRFVYGELQIIADNNAANSSNSEATGSALWQAIDGTTGSLLTPDGLGTTPNSLKLDYVSSNWKWTAGALTSKEDSSRNALYSGITFDSSVTSAAAKEKLYALALAPDDGAFDYEGDQLYLNNGQAERLVHRGGAWRNGMGSGVFYLFGSARTTAGTDIGGRSAYYD